MAYVPLQEAMRSYLKPTTTPQGTPAGSSYVPLPIKMQSYLTTNTGVKKQTQPTIIPVQKLQTAIVPGQKKLSFDQTQQIRSGETLSAAPQKSIWDQFSDWVRNTFTPDTDKARVTAAQTAYNISKTKKGKEYMQKTGTTLAQLGETGGSLFRNSAQEETQKELGIRQMPTNSEYTQMLMTGALALGFVSAPVATIKGLVSFELANKIKSGVISAIQGEGFKPLSDKTLSDFTPEGGYTTKTALDVLDFLGTGVTSELFSHSVLKGGIYKGLTEAFTKKVIEKYKLPETVTFNAKDVKTNVFENSDKAVLEFIKDTDLNPVQFTKAVLDDSTVELPSEKLSGAVNKDYWKKLKENIAKQQEIINAASENRPARVDLKVKPAKNLSAEDKITETNFTDYLQKKYPEAVEKYNTIIDEKGNNATENGRILNTDLARELDPTYTANRSKSAAVHEPASAFIKKLYEDKLKIDDPQHNNTVLFTAGGTGAGKSTAIQNVAEVKAVWDNSQIIYDTNMSTFDSSVNKIDQALKAKKEVVIAYVNRDPAEALVNGALPRAERMGRTVPLSEHVKTHIGALETIKKLAEHYKDNEHVDIQIIDNTNGKGNAKLSSLDRLQDIVYNKDELTQKLTSELNKAYERNDISETTYKGFSEQTIQAENGQANRAGVSPGASEKPQQADQGKPQQTTNVTIEGFENPVGQGRLKDSRFFKRLKESFGEDVPDVAKTEAKYRTVDLENAALESVKLATEDPKRALRIADGLEKAPEGITTNQVRKTVIEIARETKDWETFNKYAIKTSLASTRYGQEIVSLRGKNADHNPLAYVDQLVKAQKEKIVKLWNKTLLDDYKIAKDATTETKFKTLMEKQSERVRTELTRQQSRIQSAQDIINSLICK